MAGAADDDPPRRPAGDAEAPAGSGRAQADRELRIAVLVAVPVLLVGQVLLLAGWWPVAIGLVAVPGTAAALVLARRWQRLAEGDRRPPDS